MPRHWLQRRRHPRKKRSEDFPRRRSNPESRTTTGKRERARVVRDEYYTIRCYATTRFALPISDVPLAEDRRLALQALRLLMRLDALLSEARADWDQNRFRRLMHLRPRAVTRLRRRWASLNPSPRIPLGTLRRRYHANLAAHLYPVALD